MPQARTIRTSADWVQVLEATTARGSDDQTWAAGVLDAIKPIFPRAFDLGFIVIPSSERFMRPSTLVVRDKAETGAYAAMFENAPIETFEAFMRPPVPVSTRLEILRTIARSHVDDYVRNIAPSSGYADAVGIAVHPVPGESIAIWAGHDYEVTLSWQERELLTRVAVHIDAGFRARRAGGAVKAILSEDGRILSREDDAPPATVLENHVASIRRARSRSTRRHAEAVELWPALVAGRMSLVPVGSPSSRRYEVIENPPASMKLRALTKPEAQVLDACANGLSNKLIAYSLGVSPGTVSMRLASAAGKLGLASRLELLRVAAILAGRPGRDLSAADLSAAERDVLALLERGLTNRQIAALRSRSTRTIANQVASLLRKTKMPSRRALIAART